MSAFDKPLKFAASFDPERAQRTLGELEALAPDLKPFCALIGSAAGNSPYLARLMLKDAPYLSHLLAGGPEPSLAALQAEAPGIGRERDFCQAVRRFAIPHTVARVVLGMRCYSGAVRC